MAESVQQLSPAGEESRGGDFLFTPVGSTRFMTPERFTEEQRQFHSTGADFIRREILPVADRIEQKDNALLRQLLAKAGELGLLGVDVSEELGGLGLDKTTSMLVGESQAGYGSWATTFGAHTGIGTLPIVFFGTPEQKAKYLPDLATGRKVAAYALSEAGSGSDALGAKTVAQIAADGKHYLVNGGKMWITNGGFADVYVVFLKIDGTKFTAMIVERGTPGFTQGREEHKLGIRGSSTTPLIFEDCKVPVVNVLGEIGKGHKIAFNILNVGRLKLAAFGVGGMKYVLKGGVEYAAQRKQFGRAIAEFGLVREKLARAAAQIYAAEAMTYRAFGSGPGVGKAVTLLPVGRLAAERRGAEMAKRQFIFAAKWAASVGTALEERQEVLAALADVAIEVYAMDSVLGRTLATEQQPQLRDALCRFYCMESRE